MKIDLERRRAELDARCEQIDAAYRRLIAAHGSSEDEVYRLLHPPLASELKWRKDVNAEMLQHLDYHASLIDLQERRRLLPSPRPPRSRAQPIRNRRLRDIGRGRHLVALLRADVWNADEGRLVKIERELLRIDLTGLQREANHHLGRVIGGHRQASVVRSVHVAKSKIRALDRCTDPDHHYQLKRLAVMFRRKHAGQYLSRDACATMIADWATTSKKSATDIKRGLMCRLCDDPPGYSVRRRA